MNRIEVLNEFITEAANLQEQINTLNNRLIPEFRLGNRDMKGFKSVATMIKLGADALEKALAELEEEE